jgi:hypothetical protein
VWVADNMGCDRRSVRSWVERWSRGDPLQVRCTNLASFDQACRKKRANLVPGMQGRTKRAKRPTRIMNPERTESLLRLVRGQNDLYLDELADAMCVLHGVRPSVSTVCRTLVHECGITRKLVRTTPIACAGRIAAYPDPHVASLSCTVAPGRRMRCTRPRSRRW